MSDATKAAGEQTPRNMLRSLALDGLMIALSIALTRFASYYVPIGGTPGARLGLGPLPIIFASIALGPVHGLLVGMLSDVTGHILVPAGAYLWQLTVISAVYGVLPWVIVRLRRPKSTAGRVWLGVAISRLVLNVGWLPLVLHDVSGMPYIPGVVAQAALSVVLVPALAVLTMALMRVYERTRYGRGGVA